MSSRQERPLPKHDLPCWRDRSIVAVALILLTALAWAYLLHLDAAMSASAMPAMRGMNMGPASQPFAPAELA
jgi:predicted metal-binding membrane protein